MKLLKTAFLSVLACLFLFSCASFKAPPNAPTHATIVDRKAHEPNEFKSRKDPSTIPPDNFYVKHDCWKSPFNPHEVIRYWDTLMVKSLNPQVAMAVVGNPKINWETDWDKKSDPTLMPVPKGEPASAVAFVLAQTSPGVLELVAYGYINDLGITVLYSLNQENMCYELEPNYVNQSSCFI